MNQFKMMMLIEDCQKNPKRAKDELLRSMYAQTGFKADPKASSAELLDQFKEFMLQQGRGDEYAKNYSAVQDLLASSEGKLKASDVLNFMLQMPGNDALPEDQRDALAYCVRRSEGG